MIVPISEWRPHDPFLGRRTPAKVAKNWIVAQAKPLCESRAAHYLRAEGAETYLPVIYDPQRHRRVPLFIGYLFVHLSDPAHWGWVRYVMGVSRIVMDGETPGTISNRIIKELRSRENKNGVIEFPNQRFRKGQKVSPIAGYLKDQVGLYDGMRSEDRVKVLFQMFGREVSIFIRPQLLQVAV